MYARMCATLQEKMERGEEKERGRGEERESERERVRERENTFDCYSVQLVLPCVPFFSQVCSWCLGQLT